MHNEDEAKNKWKECKTHVFWGEIAPTDHLVQIYENDEVVMDSLEGFVDSGFQAGDSVIIIATSEHLKALNNRLAATGFNLKRLQETHQYIPLNVNESLAKFMVDGTPDEALFMEFVKGIIALARGKQKSQVRAYGEMVAVLWGQGHNTATVQLENLWNKFCETESFCLFCAYPKNGFTQDANDSIKHICSTHTKILSGIERSRTEVFYKEVENK